MNAPRLAGQLLGSYAPPVALAFALAACGHVRQLDTRVQQLSELTRQARERGAYRCAPEELAEAEAQLEFATRELREGDQPRAREHLILAHANASAALRLSAAAACRATRSYAPEAVRNEASMITTQLELRRGSTKEHAAI
ncbi:MAG: Flagellar motor rotation protein MotB [Myxococcaceae bacterium]|nr:Flagellar motor rotation protein MotB [Myxococcaceae bacterium]